MRFHAFQDLNVKTKNDDLSKELAIQYLIHHIKQYLCNAYATNIDWKCLNELLLIKRIPILCLSKSEWNPKTCDFGSYYRTIYEYILSSPWTVSSLRACLITLINPAISEKVCLACLHYHPGHLHKGRVLQFYNRAV